ncbi:AraC family transcriptional regulator [Sphingobacterium sp. E70]|nr:AraC family transcriptional regulator [Sphingobacterium sp. E70]ULT25790.1 AraC family transcriptional regulator [Sphingobacterium sp. E70]
MSEQYGLKADSIINPHTALLIQPGALIKGFVDSLVPYLQQQMDDRIVALKARELVLLLIQLNPAFKNVLFDFNEPGKIDLEAFMNSHYRYNVPLERFAFLTGRSLSGFKRDFEKQFHTSPGRWLLQKRLDTARFLIEQQKGNHPMYTWIWVLRISPIFPLPTKRNLVMRQIKNIHNIKIK